MQPEHDEIAFDWIRSGRTELDKSKTLDWAGNFVSHLMPPVFEAYAKVLHRIDVHYDFVDNPLSASENSILRVPSCEPLKSFVEGRRAESMGNRVRWKELAELLNVPFAPTINHAWYRNKLQDPWCWARFLRGPDDGYLSREECQALILTLKSVAGSEDCFFRFSDIPFYAPVNSGKAQLFRGTVDAVCDFQEERRLCFEYWWPPDQSWCVCSDYDLPFTFIGGRPNLVSALLLNDVLECIQVTPQTRINVFAPMP